MLLSRVGRGGGSGGGAASSIPSTIDGTITPPVLTLATANLTYPPQLDNALDDTAAVGDTLALEWANDSGFTSGVTDTFKLIDITIALAHAASFTGLSAIASGVHYFRSCIIRGPGNTTRSNWSNTVAQGLLLSAATSTPAATTAAIGCTTNEGSGTLYCVVTTTNSAPSPTQIKAGQNAAGTAATFASSAVVTATGAQAFSATGLTGGTVYYDWFYQESGAIGSAVLGSTFTTITGSVAKLAIGNGATGAGANKSQWLNSDGLVFAMNVDVGDCIMVRSTDTMPAKSHAEVTIGTLVAHVFAGVVDSSTALGAATVPGKPGASGGPNGFVIDCNVGNTTAGVWINGGFSGVTLGSAPVAGDILMWEYDSSAKTVLVKHKKAVGGTITTLFTGTMTSQIPTTPTAFAGGWNNTDGGTYNFGASAFTFTPTSGYAGW